MPRIIRSIMLHTRRTAITGQSLLSGHGLAVVGEESSAVVVYPDGTRLDVHGDTTIAKLSGDGAIEQILIPENRADLGNFGVVNVGPGETWVIASEQLAGSARKDEGNETWIAKILWSQPPSPVLTPEN